MSRKPDKIFEYASSSDMIGKEVAVDENCKKIKLLNYLDDSKEIWEIILKKKDTQEIKDKIKQIKEDEKLKV